MDVILSQGNAVCLLLVPREEIVREKKNVLYDISCVFFFEFSTKTSFFMQLCH